MNVHNVIAVCAGDEHSLALDENGRVWTWGRNDQGQLGIGSVDQNPHSTPQELGLTNIKKIFSGSYSCFALADDGTVWSWGLNNNDQLGDGSGQNQASPVQSQRPWESPPLAAAGGPGAGLAPRANPPKAVGLAAGDGFTLFLLDDGTVWACGKNDRGQLGDGSGAPRPIPVRVSGLTGVVGLKAGDDHALALKNDGSLWSWGGNGNGQVGDGSTAPRLSPAPVQTAGGAALSGVLAIAAGSGFSAALVNGGTVWTWGDNAKGQLGDGTTAPKLFATQAPSLSGVKGLQAGGSTVLAIRGDGWPLAWGDNSYGQLMDGTSQNYRPTPTPMVPQTFSYGLSNVSKVLAPGRAHNLVLPNSGQALSWGSNQSGQLGDGTTTNRDLPGPVNFPGTFGSLAAGAMHSLAVDSNGAVWAWGQNGEGQLGDGTIIYKPQPNLVNNLPLATAVAAGDYHSLALGINGTVWGWGYNRRGELGSGHTSWSESTPEQTVNLSDVAAIAAGVSHSLAVGRDGIVWTFGDNVYGQLGDGSLQNRWIPVRVVGLDSVAAIAGGQTHSMALKSDGTVWVWGRSDYGQLGNGPPSSPYYTTTPVQVPNLYNIAAIAAGDNYCLALKGDGTVWAWGFNNGQLGDGTTQNRLTPVQVVNLSNVAGIAARATHSLAVDNYGNLWWWGWDAVSGNTSPSPIRVPDSGGGLLSLLLPAPVLNTPLNVTSAGFTANWNAYTGAVTYYLDVATDAGFQNFVPGYMSLNVGNVTQKDVTGLDPKIPYYCRIAAQLNGKVSPASNTVVRFAAPGSPMALQTLLLLLRN